MLQDKALTKLENKTSTSVCRLCLVNGYFLPEIYGTKIPSMIQYCLNIKILPDDNLPTNICSRCYRQLVSFYAFKKKVEKNNIVLKEARGFKSKTKDIINIALQKSDINCLELDGLQKVDTLKYCSRSKTAVKLIINKESAHTDDRLGKIPQNKVILYHKAELPNGNSHVSVKLKPYVGTVQKQQDSFSFNYNIEPPPLAPLHSSFEININSASTLKDNQIDPVFKNSSGTNILHPPPLVPIQTALEVNEEKVPVALTKVSCDICKKEFETLNFLQEHKLKNCKFNTHWCNICMKTFTDKKMLIVHLKRHKVTKEYLCNVCGKRYSSPSTFMIHFRSHTGERPFKCSICDKGFVRWAGVKNHMKTHEDFKPYKCNTCDKQFKVVSNLYRHQRLHTGIYTFRCNFCDKAFYQSDHLLVHVRTYHTKEKPYLCCECGKAFVSFQRLKRHEIVHSGQKPYPCALCLRAYSNAIDLKNHNLRVHNKSENKDKVKKYSCTICDLRFWHPSRLKRHMTTHNALKNTVKHVA